MFKKFEDVNHTMLPSIVDTPLEPGWTACRTQISTTTRSPTSAGPIPNQQNENEKNDKSTDERNQNRQCILPHTEVCLCRALRTPTSGLGAGSGESNSPDARRALDSIPERLWFEVLWCEVV